MLSTIAVPAALRRLAVVQSGVVSRQQATASGLTRAAQRRLIGNDTFGVLGPGLLMVPNTELCWLGRVWAAVLIGGPNSRAAGRTAGFLHGLLDAAELPIEIFVPSGHRLADREWASFRQERPGVRRHAAGMEPPRIRVDDTVLDLCDAGDEPECVAVVTAAVQRRLCTPRDLARALERRTRLVHRKLLRQLLAEVQDGVQSPLEHRYLQDVERAHGLPAAKRQQVGPTGAAFLDVAYERFGVIIELDGRLGHVGEGQWRDRRRDNRHSSRGLLTLRFGWREVTEQPCALARQVAEVLVSRGWAGLPVRCPRCRADLTGRAGEGQHGKPARQPPGRSTVLTGEQDASGPRTGQSPPEWASAATAATSFRP